MRLKRLLFCSTLVLTMFTSISYAGDLRIQNNTDQYGTAKTDSSPCSSDLGDGGIAKPGSPITVPQIIFDIYCPFNCEAYLYISRNCEQKQRIATLQYNHDSGVKRNGVRNESSSYYVDGVGFNVTISKR